MAQDAAVSRWLGSEWAVWYAEVRGAFRSDRSTNSWGVLLQPAVLRARLARHVPYRAPACRSPMAACAWPTSRHRRTTTRRTIHDN